MMLRAIIGVIPHDLDTVAATALLGRIIRDQAVNLKALPKLFAQVGIKTRPGNHVANVLFNRYVVSNFAIVDWKAARDETAQIQFADHIAACFNQLAADTLAAIIREDNRVHPVQPFAVCVMSGQSAVVGQFGPRLGRIMCV